MKTPLEEYQETGKIRCKECGLDTIETEFCTPLCSRVDCKGLMFNEEELKREIKPKLNK